MSHSFFVVKTDHGESTMKGHSCCEHLLDNFRGGKGFIAHVVEDLSPGDSYC